MIIKIKWLGLSTIFALGLLAIGVLCTAVTEAGTAKPNRYAWLAYVSHWLYLIDVDEPQFPETQDKIVNSSFDVVVLDYIPSERCNTSFNMAKLVKKLHDASHPKLVIAYIDANQAEDYRSYWPKDPDPGMPCDVPDASFSPDWLLGADPQDWAGVFNVAFWYPGYKEIWLGKSGEDGYLQGILDAGFDGVYIDWVEAYDDELVANKALADCDISPKLCICKISPNDCIPDLKREMIKWIGEIASFTRAQERDFLVIPQNAAELAQDSTYLNMIDAIAQEHVWFDGGADDNPPGDCPLPERDRDIQTRKYYYSLSEECRDLYDQQEQDGEGTLYSVSSQYYLNDLRMAKRNGVLIFTVDYAVVPRNVAWVYEKSRSEGFVPFVSNRNLDTYREPFPYVLTASLISNGQPH